MKSLLALFLLLPTLVHAACVDPPKPNMLANEPKIVSLRAPDNGYIVVVGWPTTQDGTVCCKHTKFGGGYWQTALDRKIAEGVQDAHFWLSTLRADPAVDGPVTPAIQEACNQIAAIIYPSPKVATTSTGQRPMYRLRDESLPYSKDTNPRVVLKVNGVSQYVATGTACERVPVIETTTAGQWLYTTNTDRVRGISLCK